MSESFSKYTVTNTHTSQSFEYEIIPSQFRLIELHVVQHQYLKCLLSLTCRMISRGASLPKPCIPYWNRLRLSITCTTTDGSKSFAIYSIYAGSGSSLPCLVIWCNFRLNRCFEKRHRCQERYSKWLSI